ncbi:MAG: hypothetical protein HY553_20000 [Elusimicrobia bacterium]|nr:hypothetical protein [Elusimicrobiota bacterium]
MMPSPVDKTPGKLPSWLDGLARAFDSRLQRDPKRTLALMLCGAAGIALVVVLGIGAAVWNLAPDEALEAAGPEWEEREDGAHPGAPERAADSSRLAYGRRGASSSRREGKTAIGVAEAGSRGRAGGERAWKYQDEGGAPGGEGAGKGGGARGGAGAAGAGARLAPASGFGAGGGSSGGSAQFASASPVGLAGARAAAGGAAAGGIFSAQAWKRKIQALGRVFVAPAGSRGGPRQAVKATGSGARPQPGGGAGSTAYSTGFGGAAGSGAVMTGAGAVIGAGTAGGPVSGPSQNTGGQVGGSVSSGNGENNGNNNGPLTPSQIAELQAARARLVSLLSALNSGIGAPGVAALKDMIAGGRPDLTEARRKLLDVRNEAEATRRAFQQGIGVVPDADEAVRLLAELHRSLGDADVGLDGFERTLAQSREAESCLNRAAGRLACVNGPVLDAISAGPRQRNAGLGFILDMLRSHPPALALARNLDRYRDDPPASPGRRAYELWNEFIERSKRDIIAAGRLVHRVLANGIDLSPPTTSRGYLDVRAPTGNGETIAAALTQSIDANDRALTAILNQHRGLAWALPAGSTALADAQLGLQAAKEGFAPIPGISNIPWNLQSPEQTNVRIEAGARAIAGGLQAADGVERIIAHIDQALARRPQ